MFPLVRPLRASLGARVEPFREAHMRFIRTLFTLIVVVVIGVLAYNYWSGHGLTLFPSGSRIDAEAARAQGKAIADKTATAVGQAATKIGEAVDAGSVTLKI